MTKRTSKVCLWIAGMLLFGTAVRAQSSNDTGMRMMSGGMMGMKADSSTMAQMLVIHELVSNNAKINRTATNLPNGIRTVTESDDPRVAQLIKDHVITMDQRLVKGDDPALPMESPALRAIFRGKDKISTVMEATPNGIIVVQTSTDSALVVALQQHAAEVTDLVQRGMMAMHEAMMKTMGGMMMRGCPE